jgi:hypothetical protein
LSDIIEVTRLWKDMMNLHQGQDKYFILDDGSEKAYQKYAEENIQSEDKFFKVCLFLASKNPSSAELNFPSTPIPLLGFHG